MTWKKTLMVVCMVSASGFMLGVLYAVTTPTFFRSHLPYPKITIPSTPPSAPTILPSLTPTPVPLPTAHEIPPQLHVFQTFNNCGPATLSMALSYVGKNISQQELGYLLRPYQVPGGDNDDKSVTLQEVAAQAESYGFHSYLRPNGTMDKIKQFVAHDIPVVTRTWLKVNEDIGHYRVIRGYNDEMQEIIQDDSLQGQNLRFSYGEFQQMWLPFNYEYLVIVDESKKESVERILGSEQDDKVAWQNALERMQDERLHNPDSWHLTFAISRIYYYLGDYARSIEEFTRVEHRLSPRTLWYQIEPILALYEHGDYERVFRITDTILARHNRAFSELYLVRGDMYKAQGNPQRATAEYEKAVYYNTSNPLFRTQLESIIPSSYP